MTPRRVMTTVRSCMAKFSGRPGKFVSLTVSAAVLVGSLGLAIAAVSQTPLVWTRSTAPTAADLKGLAVVDATTSYAVGSNGTVLSTRDGGSTWDAYPMDTTATLNAVDAPAVGTVWAVGADGTIASPNEAGAWVTVSADTAADLFAVDFADRLHGWAVGEDGTVVSTADGGLTWAARTVDVPAGVALRGVRFLNEATGWAWGDSGTVIRTSDGGATWSMATAATGAVHLVAGSFVDTQTGWVAGGEGVVKSTIDGGATWTTQTIDSTGTVTGMAFTDALRGFLVGGDASGAFVRKTVDGGATWTSEPVEATATLRAIGAADADHAWAVGDAGLVLSAAPVIEATPIVSDPAVVPAAPVAVFSRALRDNQVIVSWEESLDTTGVVSYQVWRSVAGEPYAMLATVSGTARLSYTDQTAPSGSVVAYQVSAVDDRGQGPRSEPTGVTTPDVPVASGPAQGIMSCQGCHPAHGRLLEKSTDLAADRSCFDCHQTDIGAALSGGDPSTRHDLLTTDQSATGARLACSNCHQPHATSETTPVVDPDLPSTAGGLPGGTDAFCLKCHDGELPTSAQTAPWVAAPLATGGVATTTNIAVNWSTSFHGGGTAAGAHLRPGMGYAAGDKLSCSTCHDPHGSTNRWTLRHSVPSKDGTTAANGLLVRSLPAGGADFRLFCAGCHSLAAHPTGPGGADLTVWPLDCTTCHSHAGGL